MKLNHSIHALGVHVRWTTFINGWGVSLILYLGFACAVFMALGNYPLLGPDHISYMVQADTIRALHPDGAYWHNLGSIHNEGVFLSYLYPYTGDHVQSMKLFLALLTLPYLLTFEWLLHCAVKSESHFIHPTGRIRRILWCRILGSDRLDRHAEPNLGHAGDLSDSAFLLDQF